jgi:hypothetical protein
VLTTHDTGHPGTREHDYGHRVSAPIETTTPATVRTRDRGHVADLAVAAIAVALVAAANLAITWLHWYSLGRIFAWAPPLFGHWAPRIGPGTPVVVLLAIAVIAWGPALAARLAWRRLALLAYGTSVAWTFALAMINGWQRGLAGQFTSGDQYLLDVHRVTDIGATLRTFTTHILTGRPDSWITQVSGHPPGALLVFVLLHRIGLGGGGPAAVACLLVGAVATVAVPATIRALGDETAARAVIPFTVLFPGAIFLGVSADGLFTGVTATGLLILAHGARKSSALLCAGAGVVLGAALFLSYGMALIAVVALAVCVAARSWRAVAFAGIGALLVVAGFAAAGFWWFDGYQLVQQRYYQDLGRTRPYDYWVWADLAALVLSSGPVIAPGLRRAVLALRSRAPVAILAVGAAIAIATADKSGLSKAEVERIWLPFAVWLMAAAALLPARSRQWWLAAQAVTAVAVAHLVMTNW